MANPCSVWGGIAGGGQNSIVDYDSFYGYNRKITIHELVHNYGIAHANLITCNWVNRTSIVNSCIIQEYGDNSDFMGSGWGTILSTNMYNRVLMGFYNESLFINASTKVTKNYTLKDTNQFNRTFVTDSLALTFYFKEINLGLTSGKFYDGTASTNRYIIELWSGSGECNVYIRIIMNKNTYWWNKRAFRIGNLTLGQSYKDVINSVEFVFVEKHAACLTAKILVKV